MFVDFSGKFSSKRRAVPLLPALLRRKLPCRHQRHCRHGRDAVPAVTAHLVHRVGIAQGGGGTAADWSRVRVAALPRKSGAWANGEVWRTLKYGNMLSYWLPTTICQSLPSPLRKPEGKQLSYRKHFVARPRDYTCSESSTIPPYPVTIFIGIISTGYSQVQSLGIFFEIINEFCFL